MHEVLEIRQVHPLDIPLNRFSSKGHGSVNPSGHFRDAASLKVPAKMRRNLNRERNVVRFQPLYHLYLGIKSRLLGKITGGAGKFL